MLYVLWTLRLDGNTFRSDGMDVGWRKWWGENVDIKICPEKVKMIVEMSCII